MMDRTRHLNGGIGVVSVVRHTIYWTLFFCGVFRASVLAVKPVGSSCYAVRCC